MQNEIRTPDLHLAAYYMLSLELLRLEHEGSRAFFVFHDPDGRVEQLRRAWVNGTDAIPSAQRYAANLKALKFEIFHGAHVPPQREPG
jgi:hypothetical protein